VSAYLLDTNALIYYYEGDPLGQRVESLLRAPTNRFYVTDLARVEIHSALAGRVRRGDLSQNGYRIVAKRFSYDLSSLGSFMVQPIRRSFVEPCIRMLEDYALRQGFALATLDCIHLLAALDLKQREPDLRLVTADRVLANIADLTGVSSLLLEPQS
jgi:predicted nucleic acid-binding protein